MSKKNTELTLLRVTTIICLAFGILGIVAAHRAHSKSMFFDGMYSLVQSLFILTSGIIVTLLFRKDDERFQFGYSAFEPFFIVIRSVVLLTMNFSLAFGALGSALKEGYLIDTSLALSFSLVSLVVCLIVWQILSRFAKNLHSPVLKAEARSWFLDSAISSASVLAIIGIGVAQRTGHLSLAYYIDPIITIVFVLALSPVLSSQLRDNTRELLGGAPPEKIQKNLKKIVSKHVKKNDFLKNEIFAAKQGRNLSITAYIFLKKEMPLKQLDMIRKDILSDLQHYCSWSEADIVFTIDSSWIPLSLPSAISGRTS
ncbi:putative Co/Zn/Cd cation transporter [Sphaerochaeta pleomorpha str. Grapes]|uniref:Putative Co/Zn/Cd cation transporter n=1 Tax=Sphaerochaeta pleomorpha (strain ATCC BAA-1885 / DSM 22778 / Grapes) TaxID=158190 RepID=G8QQ63_SPHPG|nr:cation transporter [Sphaerochaeta pleomorpha]AEV28640.1 putative Co/Zn/Cd cation transporter [Sphaerochaeta pleomorpha str. Grapes]